MLRRGLLVLAAACGATASDARAYPVDRLEAPTRISGTLTVTFASDAATCGAVGRCGIEGRVSLVPGAGETILVHVPVRRRGGVYGGAGLSDPGEGETVVSEVRRTTPDGVRVCRDRQEVLTSLRATGTRRDVRLRFDPADDLLLSRCGVPVMDDVAALLPELRTSFAGLRRAPRTLTAAADHPFTAGGFTGLLRSDLRFAIGRPRVRRTQSLPHTLRRPPDQWRVERVAGGLELEAVPLGDCAALDACGLVGRYTVESALGRRSGGYAGDRGGVISWEPGGRLVTTVERPGSAPCRDEQPLLVGFLPIERRAGRLRVGYDPALPRTRCPGPPFGWRYDGESVAFGTTTAAELAAPRPVVRLDTPGATSIGGYRVSARQVDLTVGLRRLRR